MSAPDFTADLVVRAATAADRGALMRMLTAQLREHGLSVDDDGIARAVELALLSGSSAWLVIALASGLPAGVLLANPIVSVEHGGAALWIEELYVLPEKRRRGVARALLAFVQREARNHGMRALELEVVPTQRAALDLYRALGFHTSDRIAHVLEL